MLQFVKSGPEFLIVSSNNSSELRNYLITEHQVEEFTDQMPEGQIDFSTLDQKEQ